MDADTLYVTNVLKENAGMTVALGVALILFGILATMGWGWMLFSGIVSGLLGFLIMYQWPVSGRWAIGVLVGVRLIFTGWSVIALGSFARAAIDEVESAANATA